MHQFKQFIEPVATSGCPKKAEALLMRGGHRYLYSYQPGSVYAASCTDESRISDECAKTFLSGKSKIALYHNRNTSLSQISKLDDSAHHQTVAKHKIPQRISKEKSESEVSRSSNLPKPIPSKVSRTPRTYAQMIAEYSEWLEKKKLAARAKEAEQSKGLLSKLPFDAVVSSLTKLERPKLGRNRSLSGESGIQRKGSIRPLVDYSAKNDKNKMSPHAKDVQKREYNTKESLRPPKVEERREVQANRPKSDRPACPKITNGTKQDVGLACPKSSPTIKRQSVGSQWIRLKSAGGKMNSINIVFDDVANSKGKPGNVDNLNITTLGDKIEIQIPIDMTEYASNSDSKILLLNYNIPRKLRENQNLNNATQEFHTLVHSGDKRTNEVEPTRALPKLTHPKDRPSESLQPRCRSFRWRSFAEGETKTEVQAIDVIQPMIKDPPKKLLDDEKALKPKRRKKLTSIGKITRHIEEELEEKKRELKTRKAQPAIDNPRVERMAKDKGKKGASEEAKSEKDGKQGEKPNKKDASSKARSSDSNLMDLGISLLPNSIKAKPKSKKLPGAMKPIEKRPDGTLIDFGLKVPTRKPRPRSTNSRTPTSAAPKQQQQQQQDKKVKESLALIEPKKRDEPDEGGAAPNSSSATPRSSGDKGSSGREARPAAGLSKCSRGDGLLKCRPELLFWDAKINGGSQSSIDKSARYLFSPWLNRFHTRKYEDIATR